MGYKNCRHSCRHNPKPNKRQEGQFGGNTMETRFIFFKPGI